MVLVDPGQAVEVLIILVENALDVVDNAGRISIRVRADGHQGPPDRTVFVTFEIFDDGPGIASEHFKQVFNPFFTTKPRGTGLGLSIGQRLVHDNGGYLNVSSVPGAGTAFQLLLPSAS